jgi:hypothetical protein
MLTTDPLLRHFDPAWRTAVHIDASQHAVGAVLLQWEEGEQDPRPVCFLSRELQGSQWHYDSRNAEALAAQVALAAWRPLLYGVHFELVSNHASLRHLFQQKAPSARILRLCEFLADFNFQEVQFVKGSDNAVPDFLSRPWDADLPDVGLHVLSHPRLEKPSALSAMGGQDHSIVVLLPVCDDNIAVFHDSLSFSLPIAISAVQEISEGTSHLLVKTLGRFAGSALRCVGARGSVELWRADISTVHGLPALSLEGLRWQSAAGVQMRESWRRAHFDRLHLFGVLPPSEGSVSVASLAVLVVSAPSAAFLPELLTAQQHDAFLQQVAEDVTCSDQGVWRDFFRNDQGFLCYQREGDAVPRICVPKVSRDALLRT